MVNTFDWCLLWFDFRVEMRLTQTNEVGELFNAVGNIKINGDADVLTSIKIA